MTEASAVLCLLFEQGDISAKLLSLLTVNLYTISVFNRLDKILCMPELAFKSLGNTCINLCGNCNKGPFVCIVDIRNNTMAKLTVIGFALDVVAVAVADIASADGAGKCLCGTAYADFLF